MQKIILIIFMSLLLLNGCENFMGPAGETGPEGPAGTPGVDGENGGNYPGGSYYIYADGVFPGITITIAFDSDKYINNGNEQLVQIPLNDHLDLGLVNYGSTWYTMDVPYGSYFLYAWVDLNGDGVFDLASDESNNYEVFDPFGGGGYYFSNDVNGDYFDNEGGTDPHYSFDENFAPEFNFTFDVFVDMGQR